MSARVAWLILSCSTWTFPVKGDTQYFKRILFDNSLTDARYYYSNGRASGPSTLTLNDNKLPVESTRFFSGPNSLVLEWKSMRSGGWTADITVPRWRNRELYFAGDTLYFWCFSPEPVKRGALPLIVLSDTAEASRIRSVFNLSPKGSPANRWTSIAIPLRFFSTASVLAFDPHRVQGVAFVQGVADEVPHQLLLDELRIDDDKIPHTPAPATPTKVHAQGYERHIDISWTAPAKGNADTERYVIYRSQNGEPFRAIATQVRGTTAIPIGSDRPASSALIRLLQATESTRSPRHQHPPRLKPALLLTISC